MEKKDRQHERIRLEVTVVKERNGGVKKSVKL